MKDKRVAISDEGSTIVEVSCIMPVLIFIIVFIVFWFLDIINDAMLQGEVYYGIYTLTPGDNEAVLQSEINEEIKDRIVGQSNEMTADIKIKSGEISAVMYNKSGGEKSFYVYQDDKSIYKREYDKCTQRLRRWQLYGDVLRE